MFYFEWRNDNVGGNGFILSHPRTFLPSFYSKSSNLGRVVMISEGRLIFESIIKSSFQYQRDGVLQFKLRSK